MADELLLAIETSSRTGSVALAGGQRLLGRRRLSENRPHTSALLPAIDDLLRENGRRLAEVDIFAYSCGPGSFTGLRVAATVGRMMQSAVGCRVVAVPTLEVIARNTLAHPDRPKRVAALLDAKRGQVYGAVYERVAGDELRPLVSARLCEPATLLDSLELPFSIIGEGVRQHADACVASAGRVLDEAYWPPSAEHVLAIGRRLAAAGQVCKPEEIVPLYIRPPECEEVYEQRRAAARRKRGE